MRHVVKFPTDCANKYPHYTPLLDFEKRLNNNQCCSSYKGVINIGLNKMVIKIGEKRDLVRRSPLFLE